MPYIKLDGSDIRYEVTGEGYPLILLAGFAVDSNSLMAHIAEFKKHYRCIMIDNPGTGGSSKPEDSFTTKQMAQQVIAVMDELDIESANILGISMGAAIAMEVAIDQKDRIKKMVLSSAFARCDEYSRRVLSIFRNYCSKFNGMQFLQLVELFSYSNEFYNENAEILHFAENMKAEKQTLIPKFVFYAQIDAILNHDCYDRLKDISAETLIMVGESDNITPPSLAEEIENQIENSELMIIKGGSHNHHWENIGKFNDEVMKFLNNK